MPTIVAIRQKFAAEFSFLNNEFEFHSLSLTDAQNTKDAGLARPGVYIFWKEGNVIKVGRSFTNAKKRALQHVADNTGGTMGRLKKDVDVRLLLFLARDTKTVHWVAALEVFLEHGLLPAIRSKRLG